MEGEDTLIPTEPWSLLVDWRLEIDWTISKGTEALSPKEAEVALLVGYGMKNPQIAEALQVKLRTVETYLQNI